MQSIITPNFKNRTVWTGDNLPIMRGLNSESVDLIYLDPPFNSNKDYAAPIGSKAAGAAFKDTWTLDDVDRLWLLLLRDNNPTLFHVIEAARLVHGKGMAAYLAMMAQRLRGMRRILKPHGSIYLHCDPTASHYLKMLMDAVFGRDNFRNEIAWHYRRWPAAQRNFQRMHDTVLFYSSQKGGNNFNKLMTPLSTGTQKRWRGKKSRVAFTKEGTRMVTQMTDEDSSGAPMDDVWDIPVINSQAKERIGYPTQKPLVLLERIIQASSNEGDIVLDPFAGCATACVAAERLGRQWIGIDISEKAAELVQVRIRKEVNLFHDFKPIHRTDQPHRTDMGALSHYRTHIDPLYGKQSGYCGGCMEHFLKWNMTVDHIVPKTKGGTDHVENLWLLWRGLQLIEGDEVSGRVLEGTCQKGRVNRMAEITMRNKAMDRFDALLEAMVVRGRPPDRRKSKKAVSFGCTDTQTPSRTSKDASGKHEHESRRIEFFRRDQNPSTELIWQLPLAYSPALWLTTPCLYPAD